MSLQPISLSQSKVDRKLPDLPLGVTALTIVVLGISYWLLQLPYKNYVLLISFIIGFTPYLIKIPSTSFLLPNRPSWLVHVILPAVGIVSAALHWKLQLRGGIVVQMAIIASSFGLVLILSTDLFLSLKNRVHSPEFRLIPLSTLFAFVITMMIFVSMGNFKIGLLIGLSFLLIPLSIVIVHHAKHYVLLAIPTFILALWPLISLYPGLNLLLNMLGVMLILVALFRSKGTATGSKISATTVYVSGGLYILWITISFLNSTMIEARTALKIFSSVGQMLFLFGLLLNLRIKKDLFACLIGFVLGTFIIIFLMFVSVWDQLTHIDPIRLVSLGIRASVAGQSSNFVIIPVVVTCFLAFGFVLKSTGMWQKFAVIIFGICFVSIILSSSRAALFTTMLTGLILSFRSKRWRNVLLAVLIGLIVILLIGYFINPAVTKSLARIQHGDSGRLDIWKLTWDLALDHPFLGYGPNTSRFLLPYFVSIYKMGGYDPTGGRAHNVVLTEIFDSGFVGFALLILVYFFIWRWIVRKPGGFESPWILAGIGILLAFGFRGILESNGVLFVHETLGECYPPLLAMIIAAGAALPDNENTTVTIDGERK